MHECITIATSNRYPRHDSSSCLNSGHLSIHSSPVKRYAASKGLYPVWLNTLLKEQLRSQPHTLSKSPEKSQTNFDGLRQLKERGSGRTVLITSVTTSNIASSRMHINCPCLHRLGHWTTLDLFMGTLGLLLHYHDLTGERRPLLQA